MVDCCGEARTVTAPVAVADNTIRFSLVDFGDPT
jgi:hypothetical protein